MKRAVPFTLGDIVKLKKPHPCGSDRWEITRTGMDIGLKCLGCGRRVMLPRTQVERGLRGHWPKEAESE